MTGLLSHPEVSETERLANDRHQPAVVLAVLALLCLYLYLFTPIADLLGLASPQTAAAALGFEPTHLFARDGLVDTRLFMEYARSFGRDEARLVLLLIVIGAFLSTYFLPLRFKQGALALWTLAGIGLLFGSRPAAGLLMAHLVVYLLLHPGRRRGLWLGILAGLAGYWAFLSGDGTQSPSWWLAPVMALLATGGYRYAVLPGLAHPHIAALLRTAVIQSPVLVICAGLAGAALGRGELTLALGMLLFLTQWARLTLYHVDYRDGLVPRDVSLDRYLSVFLNPGILPNWIWGMAIPQGYAYVNARFLCRDKNRIVLAGLQLLGIALLYLVFWNWIKHQLVDIFSRHGVEVYNASIRQMTYAFSQGDDIGTVTVLLTSLLDMVSIVLVVAGVLHFKVGVWRLCGYDIEPSFNKPWLATNLMAFWTRFAFHYREFLVRVFYYPMFFHFLKGHPNLRILLASLAAAGLGNLIAHLVMRNLSQGIAPLLTREVLVTWPYFILLGLGIATSLIFMRRYKRWRKPWTLDRRFATDLLAAYVTLQYFALIHIFARPAPNSTPAELAQLFLLGLGIDFR